MNLGMTSLTFRNYDIQNVIDFARRAGVKGIEWGVSDEHIPLNDFKQAERIKKISKENGIEIFSLGSYCRMTDKDECDKTLETAIMLGAPVIRIWAGSRAPADCDEAYIKEIIQNSLYMAKKAKEKNIKLGFEYHQNTLTQEWQSAISLIKSINMDNVGLYWQPLYFLTPQENAEAQKNVLPYLIGNMHIHNFSLEEGYKPLSQIKDSLYLYYNKIKKEKYNLLIEFVKDESFDSLVADVDTLQTILM